MGLLPGSLKLNKTGSFISKKVKCCIQYKDINQETELYIANSYGKYENDNELEDDECYFLKYEDGQVGGVCKKYIGYDASSRTKQFRVQKDLVRNFIWFNQ